MGISRKVTTQTSKGKTKKKPKNKSTSLTKPKTTPKISFNETFFRALIEHNSNAITLINSEGIVIYDSPAASGMLGYSPTEWIGKNVFALVHPDDLQEIQTLFANLVKTKAGQARQIFRVRHKDNHWVWIDVVATNLLAQPNVQAVIVNYRDVTQHKHAMESQKYSEERMQFIIEQSPFSIQIFSPDGLCVQANQAWEKLWGSRREQLVGYNILDDPKVKERGILPYIQKAFAGELIVIPPTYYDPAEIGQAGNARWATGVIYPVKDAAGQIREVVLTHEDITERKQAEEVLRASEARLLEAQSVAKVGSWETDLSTLKVTWSAQTYEIFELDRNTFQESHLAFLEFVHPDDRAKVDAAFVNSFNSKVYNTIEHRIVTATGVTKYVEEHWRIFRDDQERPVRAVGTCQDITERKRAEEALRDSESRYHYILDTMMEGCQIIGFDWRYVYVNEVVAKKQAQLKPEEMLNRTVMEIYPDVESTELFATLRHCMEERVPTQIQTHFIFPDGRMGWFELSIQPAPEGIFILSTDITERKQAEAERMRLLDVLEASLNEIYMFDPETLRFQYINQGAQQNLGYSAEKLYTMTPLDIKPEFTELAFKKLIEPLSRHEKETLIFQTVHRRADGSHYPIDVHLQLIERENKALYLAIINDITERKQSEESLRRVERRSQALIEKAPDGIVLIGMDGMMEFASPSAKQIFGYEEESEVGFNPAELTHPEDLNMVLAALSDIIQDPSLTPTLQYRFLHKNGNWLWVESTFTNLQNDASVNAIVINFRDITKQKQAEENNQRQLKHLQTLRAIDIAISNSFDLKLTLDVLLEATLSQLEVSAASVLLLNLDTSTFEYKAGKGFYSTAIEQSNMRLGEGLGGESALKKQSIFIPNLIYAKEKFVRAELLQAEGFVSYYAIPLIAKGKLKGVLEIFNRTELKPNKEWIDFFETLAGQAAIAIDNSLLFESLQRSNLELESRVAERTAELNKTNMELEHANRAKDEFLANMSHELRTPLNSILGLSESMLERYNDTLNENQQKSLQVIESSGKHLLDLINDILDLSKIEAGKFDYYPQIINVNDLCKSSQIFVKTQAMKKGITLSYEIEDTISDFSADPRRLKQILVNLLTNAVKFTPNGGKVTLKVNVTPGVIRFSVIDTGIGITPENLRRLFTPFVQVESSLNRHFEGTGLGLTLVHKLTDLHGGSIEVESEINKGSRFTVNLPYQQENNGQSDFEIEKTFSYNKGIKSDFQPKQDILRNKILLVEDNQASILIIGDYLENHGYEIVIANDGVQAIEKANEINPDIILMDIQIPVMDGLEAIHRLRADPQFVSVPIIALTALAMPGDRERCLEAGANEYKSKPVSLKELRKIIETLLNR